MSSVMWAEDQSDRRWIDFGGDWSWKKAREYFYIGLTGRDSVGTVVAADKTQRDAYFAKTFQAVGQIMHLVQDASVPAHVRNDSHLAGDGYEKWVDRIRIKSPELFGSFTATPISYDSAILNETPNALAPVPIAKIFDADHYNGTNPSTNLAQGIAEYTNANFASAYTIFAETKPLTDKHYFPYPQASSTNIQNYSSRLPETVPAEDGIPDTAFWIAKTGDGETYSHFVKPGYFTSKSASGDSIYKKTFILDETCHKDYATLLLPRAVGYSAGLLNYFFRGKIDLIENETGPGYIIVNNTNEAMEGTVGIYQDDATNTRTQLWTGIVSLGTVTSGSNRSAVITFTIPTEDNPLIIVFQGKLGNEEGAVVGNVVKTGLYILAMPVDHETREGLGKRYYRVQGNTLSPVTEQALPFSLIDDGAYWDDMTETWTKKEHPESLGVPLGVGGLQYLAKYRDEANQRVRYVPNGSYEKEAYQGRITNWIDEATGEVIKNYHSVTFIGSPAHNVGAYQENPGWMEYDQNGLAAILSVPPEDPQERFFTTYSTLNFNDKFIETPVFKYYGFDTATREQAIPKDPQAPLPAIISAHKPEGATQVELTIPGIYSSELFADDGARVAGLGSSGLDQYQISFNAATLPVSTGYGSKCSAEDINCGLYHEAGAPSTLNAIFDIPSNDNNRVRVHYNDAGQFYEELYISNSLVETTFRTADRIQTHFQILASHKNIALVRKTQYVSSQQVYVPYQMPVGAVHAVLAEHQWDFRSTYAIYIGGVRYDLPGTTTVRKRYVGSPETPWPPDPPDPDTLPPVNKIAQTSIEDITGYHLDRIFISETFDHKQVLVAFDEYAYNNGEGFMHELRYEPGDSDPQMQVLYYAIPEAKMQNADHEATRTGRKLLLFNSDGTLKAQLTDPVGLEYTIGSIGILN